MFRTLKDLFDSFTQPTPSQSPTARAHAVQLAAAVLLVEVVRSESSMDEAERTTMVTALRSKFALSDDELERLLELAVTTSKTAYDYQRFTSSLNEHFTQDQKIQLVEAMWQVAYADAHIDANENHTISKVAGLLHVTHGEYIAAKMRAKEAAQPFQTPR
ncbi:TerB family tellurite resistance protein [Acidovorax sp. D2M1]|uniref:TerB family tellurite resistance protein n=1 Tax=Acidovorax benzenivorans TaxID=2987520 RepID=A0ABT5S1R3_9BURK|nr:TerB family tellurite resistance protein [Acidovorax benzenivorans]MDD2179899.1 TerB family tellurite resistance protein [Acidovorax benzenivorans]